VIVTDEPLAPVFGVTDVTLGAGVTVNVGPAGLDTPPAAVTTIAPAVAGTTAVILFVVQLVIDVAGVLPNFTALPVPCVLKFVPVIVTDEPLAPVFGVTDVTLGAAVTVKPTPALAKPLAAVTTTLPVAAPVGTIAVMLVLLQPFVAMVATLPLKKVTFPVP